MADSLRGFVLPHADDLTETDLMEKVRQLAPSGCGLSQAVLRMYADLRHARAVSARMLHDLQLTVEMYEGYVKKPDPTTVPAPASLKAVRDAALRIAACRANGTPGRIVVEDVYLMIDARPDLTPPHPVVETPAPVG